MFPRIEYQLLKFMPRGFARDLYRLLISMLPHGSNQKILINSVPKSGTNLALQWFECCPGFVYSGIQLYNQDVYSDQGVREEADLDRLFSGGMGGRVVTSHFDYSDGLYEYFVKRRWIVVNVIRDPRDVALSLLHFILDRRDHFLHELFTKQLRTDEVRMWTILNGSNANRALATIFSAHAQWFHLKEEKFISLRFEDLVQARREGWIIPCLEKISERAGLEVDIHRWQRKILSSKSEHSRTFRRGESGGWKEGGQSAVMDMLTRSLKEQALELGYPWE